MPIDNFHVISNARGHVVPRLAAALAAFAALATSSAADAKTIKIEASGIVGAAIDQTHIFGLDSLVGETFSFVATFDLTNAAYVDTGFQTTFAGGEAYDFLQPAPPSLVVGSSVFTLGGVARHLSGNWVTDLSAFAFGEDTQRVGDLAQPNANSHIGESVELSEMPGFGLFAQDYTPPSGNLCANGQVCDGLYAYERLLDGHLAQTLLNLDPTSVTITDVTNPTGAVPEPAAWALMILGFGAAGSGVRRRRRVVAA